MQTRKPVACSNYYPNAFDKLDQSIKDSFFHEEGPSTLPTSRKEKSIKSILIPCDNYKKIGPSLAWAYKEIAETRFQDTYIIIGTNNNSQTKISTYTFTDWETPLGIVKTDKELGKQLINLYPKIINEHTAHEKEHSIELQLPYLQFASRDKLPNLKIIPISLNLKDINKIRELAEKLNQFNITIIASSNIEDTGTMQYVRTLDTEGLIKYKERKKKEVKQIAPLLTLMEIAKLNNQKPRTVSYSNSFRTTKDKNNVTYYASILFR